MGGGGEGEQTPQSRARRFLNRLLDISRFAGPVIAGVAGALASTVDGWARVVLVLAVVLGAAGPSAASIRSERRRRRQVTRLVDESVATSTRLAATASIGLSSVVACLHDMASQTRREQKRATLTRLEQNIVNVASRVCGVEGSQVRAVYFRADAAGQVMTHAVFYGGIEPSNRVFRADAQDEAGLAAWQWARTGSAKLYEDLVNDPPVGFTRSPTTNYETFITVGVVHQGRVFGMLNLDAQKTGQLGDIDLKLATLLARTLALGNTMAGV